MHACVFVFVRVVAAFTSVQAPDPMFPHPLFSISASSLLPHWSVALPSAPFTPPQVAIMTGMILMSQLRALLRTDKGGKKTKRHP